MKEYKGLKVPEARNEIHKLILTIDPDKYYPVDYTITQRGEIRLGKANLKGEDLTENQAIKTFEQYEKENNK